ncbi:MAG: DeoR/GlpR family DNA-binding transcription regulator [Chloroflexota bacterium]
MKELALSSGERQSQIQRFIEQMERVSVEQLCETFEISLATARRDLDALAKDGKIQRIHGGAIALLSAPPEPPLSLRSAEQSDEKRRIGKVGADLVEDGDTVFLGSGTTVLEVAYNLRRRAANITAITNSLLAINALAGIPNIQLISLGGVLRQSEMSFIGHITEQALSQVRADKVFIGIHAIDVKTGLTNDYLPETQTDRSILNIGQQVIVVADHTKCARVSTTLVAPLNTIHTFVTDDLAAPDFLAEVAALGVRVLAV